MDATPNKPRVFLDANVLFAASIFPRWPREVLRHAIKGDCHALLSPTVIAQASRNLQRRFPEAVVRFEQILQTLAYESVSDPSLVEVQANNHLVRDVSDIVVVLAAINAHADYLISEDKDLTSIDESTALIRRHLKVIRPVIFLREVMGWTSERLEAIRYRKWQDMPSFDFGKPE